MFAPIDTPRLSLRPLVPGDAGPMFRYRSHPDVRRYQSWEPASEAEILAFIRSQPADGCVPGEWFQLGIDLRASGELAGDCGIHRLAADPRQAEIGITLAPEFQGRGLATEALRALLGYLFGSLGLHRVTGSVDPRNAASMALLARAGLRQEAHFRESYWCRGEWTDDAIFALLTREWRG
jgi:RimJ/RimL family protein N-acetyltransferase